MIRLSQIGFVFSPVCQSSPSLSCAPPVIPHSMRNPEFQTRRFELPAPTGDWLCSFAPKIGAFSIILSLQNVYVNLAPCQIGFVFSNRVDEIGFLFTFAFELLPFALLAASAITKLHFDIGLSLFGIRYPNAVCLLIPSCPGNPPPVILVS